MQHITLEEVKAACRREYDAKNLLFQNWKGRYGYGGDITNGHPCAIGAALDEESLRKISREDLHGTSLGSSESDKAKKLHAIINYDGEELMALTNIQTLHDRICRRDQSTAYWEAYFGDFLSAIDYAA